MSSSSSCKGNDGYLFILRSNLLIAENGQVFFYSVRLLAVISSNGLYCSDNYVACKNALSTYILPHSG